MNDYDYQPGADVLVRWCCNGILIMLVFFALDELLSYGTITLVGVVGMALVFGPFLGWVTWTIVRAANNIDRWLFRRKN